MRVREQAGKGQIVEGGPAPRAQRAKSTDGSTARFSLGLNRFNNAGEKFR